MQCWFCGAALDPSAPNLIPIIDLPGSFCRECRVVIPEPSPVWRRRYGHLSEIKQMTQFVPALAEDRILRQPPEIWRMVEQWLWEEWPEAAKRLTETGDPGWLTEKNWRTVSKDGRRVPIRRLFRLAQIIDMQVRGY